MRNVLTLVSILVASQSLACGSDSTSTGGGSDASASDAAGQDAGTDSGSHDASSDSTAQDSAASTCMSPAGCTTAAPVCCAKIAITGGTVPNCTTDPPVISCAAAAACTTTLGTTCTGMQTVRLCSANGDCTEPGNDKCCTFTRDGGALSFCSNALVAGIAGGTCQ